MAATKTSRIFSKGSNQNQGVKVSEPKRVKDIFCDYLLPEEHKQKREVSYRMQLIQTLGRLLADKEFCKQGNLFATELKDDSDALQKAMDEIKSKSKKLTEIKLVKLVSQWSLHKSSSLYKRLLKAEFPKGIITEAVHETLMTRFQQNELFSNTKDLDRLIESLGVSNVIALADVCNVIKKSLQYRSRKEDKTLCDRIYSSVCKVSSKTNDKKSERKEMFHSLILNLLERHLSLRLKEKNLILPNDADIDENDVCSWTREIWEIFEGFGEKGGDYPPVGQQMLFTCKQFICENKLTEDAKIFAKSKSTKATDKLMAEIRKGSHTMETLSNELSQCSAAEIGQVYIQLIKYYCPNGVLTSTFMQELLSNYDSLFVLEVKKGKMLLKLKHAKRSEYSGIKDLLKFFDKLPPANRYVFADLVHMIALLSENNSVFHDNPNNFIADSFLPLVFSGDSADKEMNEKLKSFGPDNCDLGTKGADIRKRSKNDKNAKTSKVNRILTNVIAIICRVQLSTEIENIKYSRE